MCRVAYVWEKEFPEFVPYCDIKYNLFPYFPHNYDGFINDNNKLIFFSRTKYFQGFNDVATPLIVCMASNALGLDYEEVIFFLFICFFFLLSINTIDSLFSLYL